MIPFAHHSPPSIYRVEVSGWDKNQEFFVEKSDLHWGESSGKQIELTSAIPDGAVIFLRLLPSLGADRSGPVAYHSQFIATTPDGRHQFRLHPVDPRVPRTTLHDRTVSVN